MCLIKQYELVRKEEMIKGILKLYDEGKLKPVHDQIVGISRIEHSGVRGFIIKLLGNLNFKEVEGIYGDWLEDYKQREKITKKILDFYDEGKLKVVHDTFIELCELNPYAVREFIVQELERRDLKGVEEFYNICLEEIRQNDLNKWLSKTPRIIYYPGKEVKTEGYKDEKVSSRSGSNKNV